jgi:signal transduction histidine kinase
MGLVDETVKTVRRIAADLRPGILDDFGLTAAIEWQLQQFKDRTGIKVDLEADVDEGRLSKDMATAGFRILQEALTNVVRHSEATAVTVVVQMSDGAFSLQVRDNGKGFRPDPSRKSLGLIGMRERARQMGGSVTVENAPGGGVSVLLKMPLLAVELPKPPQPSVTGS